jgi:DNA modification methylase
MAGHAGTNMLYYGDNIDVLRKHVETESVDLIYLDPPFNSNRAYNLIFARHPHDSDAVAAQNRAFTDTWQWTNATEQQYQLYTRGGLPDPAANALTAFRTLLDENDVMAYLVNMAPRLVELHRVLKPTGSIYLHCDPTMSHYLKLLLDAVFGANRFRDEVVWRRHNARSVRQTVWPRLHDVILYYGKGPQVTFHPLQLRSSALSDPHDLVKGPDGQRYRSRDLTGQGIRNGETGQPWRDFNPTVQGRHWRVSHARLDELDQQGLLHWQRSGMPRERDPDPYVPADRRVTAGDVWTDIDSVNPGADERIGYQTQKPLALLERIIDASSDIGDVVLDPFCGCGTTVHAAQRLGRRWIGIDIAFIAIDVIRKRLSHYYGDSVPYGVHGIPSDLGAADELFRRSAIDFQRWAASLVNAEPNERQSGDKGVDGIARFYIDRKTMGRVIVSVKGGENVKPEHARELVGTVHSQKAQMGILITRAEPSPGVTDAVMHGGTYTWPRNNQTYPLAQVITIRQLLNGAIPSMPAPIMPYMQPARAGYTPDAARVLAGKVFVHARATDVEPLLRLINGELSGLVLARTEGAKAAFRIRRTIGSECSILIDPAAYELERATPDEPFRLPKGTLKSGALHAYTRDLCGIGADAVLTPTRYIEAADVDSLVAIVGAASPLHPQTVLSLPIDIAWLSDEWITTLIDLLGSSPVPKAFMLGGRPTTPEGMAIMLANLRRLAEDIPQVALFRTDLAGLDLIAHGALAAAIGTSSALRQIIPPSENLAARETSAEEPGPAPGVLVRDLVTYLPGSVLADRFGDTRGPMCRCQHCGQRWLTTFLGRGDWRDARLHGVAILMEWLPGLTAGTSRAHRMMAWTRLCQQGIDGHDTYNHMTGDPADRFTPGLPLTFWAGDRSGLRARTG